MIRYLSLPLNALLPSKANKRPAIYETKLTDTLGDVLLMSGGLSSSGFAKLASIERRTPGQSAVTRVRVNLANAADLKKKMFDGDRLVVAPIKQEISIRFCWGAVARPGGYAWYTDSGLPLSSLDEDLLTETDLSTGLIVRRSGEGLEIDAIAPIWAAAITNPAARRFAVEG